MTMPALTLQGLASWLETQDPETEYNYVDVRQCLMARYLQAHQVPFNFVVASKIHLLDGSTERFPSEIDDIALRGYGDPGDETYGDALIRARAALARMAP